MPTRLVISIGLLHVLACSPYSTIETTDSGLTPEDGGAATVPAPPALPELVACPSGWNEIGGAPEGMPTTCDPWPDSGRGSCDEDEAHFVGDSSCSGVGPACPTGDWAADLPSDGEILYVRAGARPGGNGTQHAPFATITAALEHANNGTIVALGKSTFDEAIEVPEGVTLWGACAAETAIQLSRPASAFSTLITIREPNVTVRRLRLGGQGYGIVVRGDAARIEDVIIDGVGGMGIAVIGGEATIQEIVVRNTFNVRGLLGNGMEVSEGARAEVTRAVFENNIEFGVGVRGAESELRIRDVVIRGTREQDDGTLGIGLFVTSEASVELSRGTIEQNREMGVWVQFAASLTMTDFIVRDTQPQASSLVGSGLEIQSGSHVILHRGSIVGNHTQGLTAADEGTSLNMTDVVVRDTRGHAVSGRYGRGARIGKGAHAELERVAFIANRRSGVEIYHQGTFARLTDVLVHGTAGSENDGSYGVGLQVSDGAEVELIRASFTENHTVGVLVGHVGTTVSAVDLAIRDTASSSASGTMGVGLQVSEGATMTVTRAQLERNQFFGVVVASPGTELAMNEVTIGETRFQGCVDTTCPDHGGGMGIASVGGAHAELTNFVVSNNSLCGIQLAFGGHVNGEIFDVGGTMDLHQGEVSYNPIGANVQTPEFDQQRLFDRVVFRDNGRNLAVDMLPSPVIADLQDE